MGLAATGSATSDPRDDVDGLRLGRAESWPLSKVVEVAHTSIIGGTADSSCGSARLDGRREFIEASARRRQFPSPKQVNHRREARLRRCTPRGGVTCLGDYEAAR